MNENISMRDAFLNELYEIAKKDKDVVIVSADMGAPALDSFRDNLRDQFVNVGIAEQNMISIATGLAQEGKKPFTFAIAPFATSRCHEFIKLNAGLMKIPITILGVGAGFGYEDSGPTHHTTEDISILKAIPNLEILCPSHSEMAKDFAKIVYNLKKPRYVRLDRQNQPDLSQYYISKDYSEGFTEIEEGKDICIVSTGNMVHRALEVRKKFLEKGENIGTIDIYRIKPISKNLKEVLSKYKYIICLEEHLLDGGLGSLIAEIILDNDLRTKLKRLGVKEYVYLYCRNNIQKACGLDVESISNEIEKISSEIKSDYPKDNYSYSNSSNHFMKN